MFNFIISNYIIFIVIGIILLLGLFGYMMDRKKYEKYRQEILNQDKYSETLDANPNIQTVATPVAAPVVNQPVATDDMSDPMTGQK